MTDLETLLTRLSTVDENTSEAEKAELGAQVLTRVTGYEHIARSWESSRDIPGGKISVWKTEGTGNRLARNPVTNLNAAIALCDEHMPKGSIWTICSDGAAMLMTADGMEQIITRAGDRCLNLCFCLLKAMEADAQA